MACLLGQLGGQVANDQGEAPRSGGSRRVPFGRRCHFTVLGSACRAATTLDGVDGFEVPSWSAVTAGQRPTIMKVEDREPGVPRQEWQHAAALRIESETLMPRMIPVEQALLHRVGRVLGHHLCLSQFSTHANRLSFVRGASPAPPLWVFSVLIMHSETF